jgi:hypothetical protein
MRKETKTTKSKWANIKHAVLKRGSVVTFTELWVSLRVTVAATRGAGFGYHFVAPGSSPDFDSMFYVCSLWFCSLAQIPDHWIRFRDMNCNIKMNSTTAGSMNAPYELTTNQESPLIPGQKIVTHTFCRFEFISLNLIQWSGIWAVCDWYFCIAI